MEPPICRNCKTYFGCKEGLCSKCFKESQSSPSSLDPALILSSIPKIIEESKSPAPPVSVDSSKCFKCSKRLGPVNFQCKCLYYFCARHRHPEEHSCNFDHKAAGIRKLSEENPMIEAPKFQKLH